MCIPASGRLGAAPPKLWFAGFHRGAAWRSPPRPAVVHVSKADRRLSTSSLHQPMGCHDSDRRKHQMFPDCPSLMGSETWPGVSVLVEPAPTFPSHNTNNPRARTRQQGGEPIQPETVPSFLPSPAAETPLRIEPPPNGWHRNRAGVRHLDVGRLCLTVNYGPYSLRSKESYIDARAGLQPAPPLLEQVQVDRARTLDRRIILCAFSQEVGLEMLAAVPPFPLEAELGIHLAKHGCVEVKTRTPQENVSPQATTWHPAPSSQR